MAVNKEQDRYCYAFFFTTSCTSDSYLRPTKLGLHFSMWSLTVWKSWFMQVLMLPCTHWLLAVMVKCSPYLDWNSKELWASEEALDPVDTTARHQHRSHVEFRPRDPDHLNTLIDSMVFHSSWGDALLNYKSPGMPERIKMPAVRK